MFVISSCSPEGRSVKINSNLAEGSGDFGSLNFDQSTSKVFTLKNETASKISVSPSVLGVNSESFKIVSARGCADMEPQRSCQIKIQVVARGLLAGIHQASLSIAPFSSHPLSVVINPTPAPVVEVQVEGIVSNSVSFSVQGKKTETKVVALRNVGTVLAPVGPLSKDISALNILSNSCPQELPPSKICYVRLSVKGQNLEENIQGNLVLGGVTIPVNYVAEIVNSVEKIESVEEVINLGDFNDGRQKQVQVLTFLNSGSISSDLDLIALPPGYRVVASTCSNVPPKSKCYLRLEFSVSETGSGLGSHSSSISLGSTPFNINYGVVSSTSLSTVKISGNDNVLTGNCEAYQVSLEDSMGNPHVLGSSRLFSLSGVAVYSDSSCSSVISSLNFAPYESQKNLYLSSENPGLFSLSLSGVLSQSKNVNFYNQLDITPKNSNINVAQSTVFQGVGGTPPYSFSIISGAGTISSVSGNYSAPNNPSVVTIQVSDSIGNVSQTGLNVVSNLSINSGTCSFDNVPENVPCLVSSSGGIGSKVYSSDSGLINGTTGEFRGVCSGNVGQSVVTVTDEFYNQSSVTLNYSCVYPSCNYIKAEVPGVVSGLFWIKPDSNPAFKVFCDHETASGGNIGGWTLYSRFTGSYAPSKHFGSADYGTLDSSTQPYSLQVSKLKEVGAVMGKTNLSSTVWWNFSSTTATNINFPQNINIPESGNATFNLTGGFGTRDGCSNLMLSYNSSGCWSGRLAGPVVGVSQNGDGQCGNNNNWLSASSYLFGRGEHGNGVCIPGAKWNTRPIDALWAPTQEWFLKQSYYKLPKTCLDAKSRGSLNKQGNQNSGIYEIDPDGFGVGESPIEVYCDQETADGGWTLYARFDGDDQPTSHYGSTNFGTLNSTTAQYSLVTSRLGAVSKIMAKTGVNHITWNLNAQILNIPTSSSYNINLQGVGSDGCSPLKLSYHSTSCWSGRFAGPTVGVTTDISSGTCANTGNWQGTTKFYGRADHGGTCTPRGKWNTSPNEAIFMPVQEWYVK